MRDWDIQQTKDFLRAVDYLHTRPDIDHTKLGYLGFSFGAMRASMNLALEERIKTGILIHGGFITGMAASPVTDPINWGPRVTIPILMINGRLDATFPTETSQQPMFDLLGTTAQHKQRLLYERGHQGPPIDELRKQMLPWLNKYLGPVK